MSNAIDHLLKIIAQGSKGGGKSGGGSTRVAREAPNTLQSKAVLKFMEIWSEGEIVGLKNAAKSILIDGTRLQNEDGSYNFTGISYDYRLGLPDQEHMPGIPDVSDEVPVGVKIPNGSPVIRTVSDSDVDAVRVVVQVPNLTNQDTTNGDLNGDSVSYTIHYKPSGGSYILAVTDTIKGKTTSPYQRAHRINLTGNPPWDIKVTRTSPDSTVINIQNELYWASYTRILDIKMIYPDTAYIGISLDSSLFGSSIPKRSYELKGLIIQVPSNYNSITREYTGTWDGTFQRSWSDNPAWIFYDLLTNNRYGLGQYIDEAMIDKYGLYTIAQYCDELVPDGAGGMEPRFRFNYSIDSQQTALKVLQAVASAFRGMLYWGSAGNTGIITAVADVPQDAVKLFTNANVIDGLFTYSGTALQARHSVVWVTWNNPNLNYESDIEVYEDSSLIELYGVRKTDIVAYGCTSRGQARRMGKWLIETEQNEPETCVFNVGLADADTRPGDVVKVFDKDYAEVRLGGRIVSATTNSLTLDDTLIVESGQTYIIDFTMPDGSIETRTLNNTAGSYTVVTFASALSDLPNQHAMFGITASDVNPRLFRVLGVRETSPFEFQITAMVYDPGKFNRVELNIKTPALSFAALDSGPILAPTSLAYIDYIARKGSTIVSTLLLSWVASRDPRVIRYELEASRPGAGNNFELIDDTQGVSAEIENVPDGSWSFRVRAFDALGNASPYLTLANQTISVNSAAPADVTNFNIASLGNTSTLAWSPVTSKNLDHYEIRFTTDLTGATWETSQVIVASVAANQTSVSVGSDTGTFLIKAVSVPTPTSPMGIYSASPTLISTNVNALTNFTYVLTEQDDPDFDGNKDKTHIDGGSGNLELDTISATEVEPSGIYKFENVVDLGDTYTFRIVPHIVASGNNITNDVDDWPDVDLITDVDGATDGQWRTRLQVSTSLGDGTGLRLLESGGYLLQEETSDRFLLEATTDEWSDWQDVIVGDYVARTVQARLLLESFYPSVTPSVSQLSLDINMPNLVQHEDDIITVGATSVTFPLEFRNNNPAIAISAQNLAQGDYYTITGKSGAGFTIEFFNSSNVSISRTFDYVAKGYGYVS